MPIYGRNSIASGATDPNRIDAYQQSPLSQRQFGPPQNAVARNPAMPQMGNPQQMSPMRQFQNQQTAISARQQPTNLGYTGAPEQTRPETGMMNQWMNLMGQRNTPFQNQGFPQARSSYGMQPQNQYSNQMNMLRQLLMGY